MARNQVQSPPGPPGQGGYPGGGGHLEYLTADPGGPYTVNEGEILQVSGAGSSLGYHRLEGLTFHWDWGNVDPDTYVIGSTESSNHYGAEAVYTLGLSIIDPGGVETAVVTTTVTVGPPVTGTAVFCNDMVDETCNWGGGGPTANCTISGGAWDGWILDRSHNGNRTMFDSANEGVVGPAILYNVGEGFKHFVTDSTPPHGHDVSMTVSVLFRHEGDFFCDRLSNGQWYGKRIPGGGHLFNFHTNPCLQGVGDTSCTFPPPTPSECVTSYLRVEIYKWSCRGFESSMDVFHSGSGPFSGPEMERTSDNPAMKAIYKVDGLDWTANKWLRFSIRLQLQSNGTEVKSTFTYISMSTDEDYTLVPFDPAIPPIVKYRTCVDHTDAGGGVINWVPLFFLEIGNQTKNRVCQLGPPPVDCLASNSPCFPSSTEEDPYDYFYVRDIVLTDNHAI